MWYADIKSRKQTARVPAGGAGPQKGLAYSDRGSLPSRGACGCRKGGDLNESYDFYAHAGFSLLKRTLPTEGTARLLRRSLSLGSDHHHRSNMALVPTGPRDGDAQIE